MGLSIVSSDYEKDFHIGYIGFSKMRGYFVLSYYDENLYDDYNKLVNYITSCTFFDSGECPVDEDIFSEKIDDLDILISHSDCDGQLSSDECRLLEKVLVIDEDKIRGLEHYSNNPDYVERIIKLMYEFKELICYCAGNPGMELLFG